MACRRDGHGRWHGTPWHVPHGMAWRDMACGGGVATRFGRTLFSSTSFLIFFFAMPVSSSAARVEAGDGGAADVGGRWRQGWLATKMALHLPSSVGMPSAVGAIRGTVRVSARGLAGMKPWLATKSESRERSESVAVALILSSSSKQPVKV